MTTPAKVSEMEEKAKAIVREWTVQLSEVKKKTKLVLYDSNNELSTTDPFSIDFIPQTTQQRTTFGSLLTTELLLRGMPPVINFPQRIFLLKERIEAEERVSDMLQSINHKKPDPDRLYDLIMAIPCILHLEMRVGIKMLYILLLRE